ncbi:MAG: archaeosine biosynthesis radical SAM protein RaSEA [Candidatus Aminicenantes bacterium]
MNSISIKKNQVSAKLRPAFLRVSPVNIKGIETNRLMIIARSNGCEYAKTPHGGCTMCGFQRHLQGRVTEEQILSQIDFALNETDLTGVKEINFFTIGSFYNDAELSPEFRKKSLEKFAQLKNIRRVTVEGRAEYLTVEKLKESKAVLGDKILEYGIGLESSDEYIRNKVVNKGLSNKAFEEVLYKVKKAGADMFVYLLIKPFGLSEGEAVEDAARSAQYVFNQAKKIDLYTRVAFEPVFIVEGTELEQAYLRGEYEILNLWTIVEVIQRTHHLGCIFIGMSDENLSADRKTYSCEKCYRNVSAEIENFNKTQDISGLKRLDCQCKRSYEKSIR